MDRQATKKRGGKRAGAGRPKGSRNSLQYGEVRALESLRLRVPEGASEPLEDLAKRTYERLLDVMEGKVWEKQAGNVLKAATRLREEALGVLSQKIEHAGADGGPLSVSINIRRTVKP